MNIQNVQIGWLVLDDDEQQRARECLRQFREEGTLDELGFAQVRDTFAELFFPATNTIMTRTRYLFFLAAIFARIEHEKRSGSAAAELLRRQENALRETLATTATAAPDHGDMWGVIGATSKEDLQRYPSTIYWNALKRLGMFRRAKGSSLFYLYNLADYYEKSRVRHDDDGSAHASTDAPPNWDSDLEEVWTNGRSFLSKNSFAPGTDFSLSVGEAKYLEKRFSGLCVDGKPTLISHLLKIRHTEPFDYPWDVPLQPSLETDVAHAQAFSALTKGATLQYYDLLIEGQRAAAWKTAPFGMGKPFADWWRLTQPLLAQWDFSDFSEYIHEKVPARIYGHDFLAEWLELCRAAADGPSLLSNPRARSLVREREQSVRPTKHRLGQIKYLRQWKAPESLEGGWYANLKRLPYNLDYRSSIGAVFVQEIVAGLKRRA